MSFELELNEYLARKNLRHSVLFIPVTFHVPGKNTREVIGMLNKAKAKIQAEIEKGKENAYIQLVGQFLLQHLVGHPEDAEKIVSDDKTITKSLDAMRKAAEKKKVGNCGMLTPHEGFTVVLKYFGIEKTVATVAPVYQAPVAPTPEDDFDINLNDLLK